MSPLGLVAVMVLAISGLAIAGVLRVGVVGGAMELSIGRGGGTRRVHIESREGILADASLVLLVVATAALVGGSHWVAGTDALAPMLGTGAVFSLLLAKLAPRGTTYWLGVEVTAVVALFVFTAPHPANPVEDFPSWIQAIRGSVALAALVTMAGAGWMLVAWSAFWVSRKRNAGLALAPLAVVLAVEILNDPTQPTSGPLMVSWILLAGMLLLRLNTARIRERWRDMADGQVWIYIASRGAIAVIALLVIAVLLPPLSTVDLSVSFFHGRNGEEIPGPTSDLGGRSDSQATGNLTQTGYSERVAPGGTLTRSTTPVLRVTSDFGRPVYWRGINLYTILGTAWIPGPARAVTAAAGADTPLDDGSTSARQNVHATVSVLDVPQQTLFWPGEPHLVDQPALLRGARPGNISGLASVEAAYSRAPLPVGTIYTVDALQSVATEDQLRQAGTAYPAGVLQLTGLGAGAAPAIGSDVARLARQVALAGATPYDQVKNVETYLRGSEKYQLTVTSPPAGSDPISYFLFQSHTGYCEYFASAMGEMVRALGIPVRLVSGYGPGQPTPAQNPGESGRRDSQPGSGSNTIKASDAHTWVEVYFPTYGWVPFEPTPDPNYPALARGDTALTKPPGTTVAPTPIVVQPPVSAHPVPGPSRVPVALGLVGALVAAVGVLALVLARVALGAGGGADLGFAWSRLGILGRRLGVPRQASDTPLEFSRRLADLVPELEEEIMLLGAAYSRERYGAADAGDDERRRQAQAWGAVRNRLLRLLTLGPRDAVVRPGAPAPQS